jgi:uncharacterized protein YjbI with pentapeptide repeats
VHSEPNLLTELTRTDLRSGECFERRRLVGSFAETTTEDLQLDESAFLSADLSKTCWTGLVLHNCQVEKCDLANARWPNSSIDSLRFASCRATGIQLIDSKWLNSTCTATKFNLAAFHGAKLRDGSFENCDLREANFESAELTRVTFRNCDLKNARFPNCKFDQVDFRGSHLAGIQVDLASLRHACIDPTQLLDIAATLGIRLRNLGENE